MIAKVSSSRSLASPPPRSSWTSRPRLYDGVRGFAAYVREGQAANACGQLGATRIDVHRLARPVEISLALERLRRPACVAQSRNAPQDKDDASTSL